MKFQNKIFGISTIDEETWKEVLKFRIDENLKNNNEAVVKLIKKVLELYKSNFFRVVKIPKPL